MRNASPFGGEGFGLPGLVDDSGDALDLSVLCSVPSGVVIRGIELSLGEVCSIINGEVVGYGGEDYYGAQQYGSQ